MKTTLKIDLDRTRLLDGLTPRALHPPLVKAESAAERAAQALEQSRRELADRERVVAGLPARIQRGETKASALSEALRERDAAALLVEPAEAALESARARVVVEEKSAARALEREVERRTDLLERAAADLRPVLDEIRQACTDLGRVLCPTSIGMVIDWPCSVACAVSRHVGVLTANAAIIAARKAGAK
ncbi:MAG: hypothetical protein M3619_25595 [Myxococcota bacterium]|nr:hypothetical protein [Myxococcota bacterium]